MVAWQLAFILGALGTTGDTVLLNFRSSSCPHCEKMEPVLAELERRGATVQTVDVEQHVDVARRFQVQAIPTYVVLKDGRELQRFVGSQPYEKIAAACLPNSRGNDDKMPRAEVRGQSPDAEPTAAGNYVGQRLNGLFGKGNVPKNNLPATADPFTSRQNITSPAVNEEPNAERGTSAESRALAAAVRLKVEDESGHSVGSGTIIDVHGADALVVTCGHIFRASRGRGAIKVDLFAPEPMSVAGELIGYDLDRDIALVSIRPSQPVTAVMVAPTGYQARERMTVFSIGCDRGGEPSVRKSSVKSIDRYKGHPNLEVAGAPVDGRSGGGLFDAQGNLIGICNAADPDDDEGVYAALATIHWQLEQVGLLSLAQPRGELARGREENESLREQPIARPSNVAAVAPAPRMEIPRDLVAANMQSEERASSTADVSDAEVICIVRSKSNPAAKRQILVINHVSPELLDTIAHASHDPTAPADLAHYHPAPAARITAAPARTDGTVVRGQSFQR